MKHQPISLDIEYENGDTTVSRKGILLVCENCEHEYFAAFMLADDNHIHMQCAECGAVYCIGVKPPCPISTQIRPLTIFHPHPE